MITLFRWIRIVQLKVKFKLALYQFLDNGIEKLNTSELKDKFIKEIMPYLAELAHSTVPAEKNKVV